jgi:hypothetical protein
LGVAGAVKHKILCFSGGKAVKSLWISRAQKWLDLSILEQVARETSNYKQNAPDSL